jgi:UDP-N-acetylmuramate dehydrogenase
MENWISNYRKNVLPHLKGVTRFGEEIAGRTTFRIGGTADVFVEAQSVEDLRLIAEFLAAQKEVVYQILGGGSNVLYPEHFQGIVIHPGEGLSGISQKEGMVIAGSGASLMAVIKQSAEWNYGGMEYCAGIPGSVGGAVKGNAGAFGHSISERVASIKGFEMAEQKTVEIKGEDISWSYRRSNLPDTLFLTEIIFRMEPMNVNEAMDEIARILAQRMEKHPSEPSAGSVFINPDPPRVTAGRLIEELGFKGCRIGDAMCSPRHANFIVNVGNATQADVLALIAKIKEEVMKRFKIELREEIRIVKEKSMEALNG